VPDEIAVAGMLRHIAVDAMLHHVSVAGMLHHIAVAGLLRDIVLGGWRHHDANARLVTRTYVSPQPVRA
jgi:hypothetical protein